MCKVLIEGCLIRHDLAAVGVGSDEGALIRLSDERVLIADAVILGGVHATRYRDALDRAERRRLFWTKVRFWLSPWKWVARGLR